MILLILLFVGYQEDNLVFFGMRYLDFSVAKSVMRSILFGVFVSRGGGDNGSGESNCVDDCWQGWEEYKNSVDQDIMKVWCVMMNFNLGIHNQNSPEFES